MRDAISRGHIYKIAGIAISILGILLLNFGGGWIITTVMAVLAGMCGIESQADKRGNTAFVYLAIVSLFGALAVANAILIQGGL